MWWKRWVHVCATNCACTCALTRVSPRPTPTSLQSTVGRLPNPHPPTITLSLDLYDSEERQPCRPAAQVHAQAHTHTHELLRLVGCEQASSTTVQRSLTYSDCTCSTSQPAAQLLPSSTSACSNSASRKVHLNMFVCVCLCGCKRVEARKVREPHRPRTHTRTHTGALANPPPSHASSASPTLYLCHANSQYKHTQTRLVVAPSSFAVVLGLSR